MIELQRAKLPKVRKKRIGTTPEPVKKAMRDHASAYAVVFKRTPLYAYDKPYIRIDSEPGVSLQRLKQLTSQLRARARDM